MLAEFHVVAAGSHYNDFNFPWVLYKDKLNPLNIVISTVTTTSSSTSYILHNNQ